MGRGPGLLRVFLAALLFWQPLLDEEQVVRAEPPPPALDFPKEPADAAAAALDFDRRAQIVIDMGACGMDTQFTTYLNNENNEELTGLIIAKIFKYYQLRLTGSSPGNERAPFRKNVDLPDGPCHGYPVERLRQQVNETLVKLKKGKAGSSDLPCHVQPIWLTKGEYDVILRNLVRILHMRPKALRGMPDDPPLGSVGDILDASTNSYVRDQLLTLDGSPGRQSYSLYECGNTEDATGTPEERADNYTFAEDVGDFFEEAGSWLWDAFLWFLMHIVLPIVVGMYGVAPALAGVGLVPALGAAAVGGEVILDDPLLFSTVCAVFPVFSLISACRIPETENHLLMMETSRYLTNQIRAEYLTNTGRSVPSKMNNSQNDLDDWMFDHFQTFLKQDFDEYNARPYQRYSVNAILNMFDFAEDGRQRKGAELVLDYLSAKYAAGSNRARRVVPFRRLTDTTDKSDLFGAVAGADHQVNRTVLLTGLTGLLPDTETDGRVLEMIYAAVSAYRLPTAVLDLAINKTTPYVQHIHHAGVEIYASSPGFLISAGGITTGPANRVAWFGLEKDRGAALPTVLIPTVWGTDRKQLIRFEGGEDHDNNTCVEQGFACGRNPTIPADYDSCTTTDGSWRFIDSARCSFGMADPKPDTTEINNPGPHFFVAVYIRDCPQSCVEFEDSCTKAERNANFPRCDSGDEQVGVLEAVDVPTGLDGPTIATRFTDFMNKVKTLNPNPFFSSFGEWRISYTTLDGRQITATPFAASDARIPPAGYISPNRGLDNWKLAGGGVMTAGGDGVVEFRNPNTSETFKLDFSNAGLPQTVPPSIPR